MKEILWASLDRATEWVKYAESKGLAILGVHALTLGFFLNIVVDERRKDIHQDKWMIATLIAALVFAFISIYFSFRCLNPRLRLKGGISPIYFRSVAETFQGSRPYLAFLREKMATDEQIEEEVAGQVYVNFVIANKKFTDVTWALRFLVASIPMWAITAILMLFT